MSGSLYLPSEIHFGCESIEMISEKVTSFQGTHTFVIVGTLLKKGIFRSQLEKAFSRHGLAFTFYIHDKGEPTTEHLKEALVEINRCKADCIVAIGGGSVLDLAKAVSYFSLNKHDTLDNVSEMKIINRLPLIVCPTTAGTGSEATKVMVLTDVDRNVKKNPAHVGLIPDVVILDPLLTVDLPKNYTAYTGLDALAHAIEAYVSTRATILSDQYALEAIRIIAEFLPKSYANGRDIEARGKMLLASCYAGIAFSNASTNLAHATARPLGAKYHMPHGLCVALLLPFVIEYGQDILEERYAKIAETMGIRNIRNRKDLVTELVKLIEKYNTIFQIWQDGQIYMKKCSHLDNDIQVLVKDALSGNGIVTNYRIPTEKDVEKIYNDLFIKLNNEVLL